ncbi:hypothetical protein LSAT2_032809 [Lamellibrachia satsuma]|nr:hypothetical protein LSAT2_032809 [Lamellibrachia satsuma]
MRMFLAERIACTVANPVLYASLPVPAANICICSVMSLCVRTTTMNILKVAKIRAMPGMAAVSTYVKRSNIDACLLSSGYRYAQIQLSHVGTIVNVVAARAAPTTQLKTMMP